MSQQHVSVHWEKEKLRNQKQELLSRLREAIDEWHHIHHEVNPALRDIYDLHFAEFERQIQLKTLERLELARREELLRSRVERGEHLTKATISIINTFVQKEFARLRKRMDAAHLQNVHQRNADKIERLQQEEEQELPQLYRIIVKKLHPDATAESDDYKRYWHKVQDAYQEKNITRLRSILELIGGLDAPVTDDNSTSSIEFLQQDILRLQEKVRREEERLVAIKQEEPYIWRNVLENPDWLASHANDLQQELDSISRDIHKHTEFLSAIVGEHWHTFVKQLEKEQAEKELQSPKEVPFISDFMQDTYFNMR